MTMWRAYPAVIPAKAGIHNHPPYGSCRGVWVPAFAGTT
jgi:hypothetical protein